MKVLAIKIREGLVDVFALKCGDECPSLDFLHELKTNSDPDIARLTYMLDETSENGMIENNEYRFKNLKNGLYEFKASGGARLLCFLDNEAGSKKRLVICTNGVKKKQHKHRKQTLNKGLEFMSQYVAAKRNNCLEIINDQ